MEDLYGEKIARTIYVKGLQNSIQIEFRIEKVIKKKDNKLNMKRKCSNSSFNSWID